MPIFSAVCRPRTTLIETALTLYDYWFFLQSFKLIGKKVIAGELGQGLVLMKQTKVLSIANDDGKLFKKSENRKVF